jgi:hypothetical protein
MRAKKTAKDLFREYACNRFFLDRDGLKETYLALGGGDREQERAWRKEFIDDWIARLSIHDREPLRWLMNANAVEAIPVLLGMEDFGDDFMKFWYAFALENIARCDLPQEGRRMAIARAVELWREILDAPRGIDPLHRAEINASMLEAFGARTAEEYVSNYAAFMLGQVSRHDRYGSGNHPQDESC